MASSFQRWESDPLFSAAEIVQDSADRMESIFRLLLHEQSLIHEDQSDPKLLKSIEYHRRHLSTLLETTKWQLEDFERAVNSSAAVNESQTRADVILRHKQFVNAIKEQVSNLENSIQETSLRYTSKNSEWININEKDRDGLAMFLSGEIAPEPSKKSSSINGSILTRFLDPSSATSTLDGIVDNSSRVMENPKTNSGLNMKHDFALRDNSFRNVASSSHFPAISGLGQEYPQNMSCDGCGEDGSWDMEAGEAKSKNFFPKNQLRGYHSTGNFFQFLNNVTPALRNKVYRNYTKRMKDGEQMHSLPYVDSSHASQCQHLPMGLASCYNSIKSSFPRAFAMIIQLASQIRAWGPVPFILSYWKASRPPFRLIVTVLFTLLILVLLVSCIA